MTTPTETAPPAEAAPFPLRIASTLCWIVGIVTSLMALAIGIPALQSASPTALPLIEGLAAGAAVIAAAVLVRHARRLGGSLVLVAAVLPTLIGLGVEGRFHSPPLLLVLAVVTVLANWNYLR